MKENTMKYFAEVFDAPADSSTHQDLATAPWLGGPLVEVRYLLGRLLKQNLFRESDACVETKLAQYLNAQGSAVGAALFANPQAWTIAAKLLKHELESERRSSPTQNAKLISVLRALLVNPDLTNSELAHLAGTTEKQVNRMSDVKYLRRLHRSGE